MRSAVIVDVVRSPNGRRNGQLSGWHPADLAGQMLVALATRTGLDPELVDDVIMGCTMQIGAQSLNVGRNAVLAAGWPDSIPATTVDRQSSSSQQAVHFAAQGVKAGVYEVVVAAGVEVASQVPPGSSIGTGAGQPFSAAIAARYRDQGGLVPPAVAAERLAESCGFTRDDLDAYAQRADERATAAQAAGRFTPRLAAVARRGPRDTERSPALATADERSPRSAARHALKPMFEPGGRITAGNSAPVADGAAAVLIMSEEAAHRLGLTPRARFRAFAGAAVDPVTMLTAPAKATTAVLKRAGLALADLAVREIHESFAAVVLAWCQAMGVDDQKVNVNGGALALGEPGGASGTALLANLLSELEAGGGRYGLQAMGDGGGTANALIIERLG